MNRHCYLFLGGVLLAAMAARPGTAGTFANISIDDAYGDWTGVPVLDSDPLDSPGNVDIKDVQIANDERPASLDYEHP